MAAWPLTRQGKAVGGGAECRHKQHTSEECRRLIYAPQRFFFCMQYIACSTAPLILQKRKKWQKIAGLLRLTGGKTEKAAFSCVLVTESMVCT